MSILVAKNISKKFFSKEVLSKISFEISQGNFIGLLGQNGSGKTTLVQAICGLIQLDTGEIHVCDKDIKHNGSFVREKIGVLLQDNIFSSTERVIDVIINHVGYYNRSRHKYSKEIKEYLSLFNLWENRNRSVQSLSVGKKRVVALIRAIITRPELLILDEPTAGLDIESRLIVWKLLKNLNKLGMTILLTSHYADEVESLCKEIIVLKEGTILQYSKVETLFQLSGFSYLLTFQTSIETFQLEGLGHYLKVSDKEIIINETIQQPIVKILTDFFYKNVPISKVIPIKENKDEIMLKIINGDVKI
jgi:ABC-2 type transport system ATP-binding protein